MTELSLSGLVSLVTGGSSGIGYATARMLQRCGSKVAVLDLTLDGAPEDSLAVACDVGNSTSVDEAIAKVVSNLGGLDIVINNAGVGAVGNVEENDDLEWARVLNVNVTGMARVVRAALPHLRQSRHPAIVNVCSAVAFVGVRDRALYSASKGAVMALTRAMAADHAAESIRVNAVAPGTADTPWIERLLSRAPDSEVAGRELIARQPLGRLVSPDEIAWSIVSLAAPVAASTTGAILRVDGGMSAIRV